MPGSNTALEQFETTFNQDLNGDGVIGVPSGSHLVAATTPAANSTPDNFHFASDGSGTPQAIAFSVHPNSVTDQNTATPGTTPAMTGHDLFVFALDLTSKGSNATPATDDANAGNSGFAYLHALLTGARQDAFSNAAIHDAAHGTQWLAHHDFHLI